MVFWFKTYDLCRISENKGLLWFCGRKIFPGKSKGVYSCYLCVLRIVGKIGYVSLWIIFARFRSNMMQVWNIVKNHIFFLNTNYV